MADPQGLKPLGGPLLPMDLIGYYVACTQTGDPVPLTFQITGADDTWIAVFSTKEKLLAFCRYMEQDTRRALQISDETIVTRIFVAGGRIMADPEIQEDGSMHLIEVHPDLGPPS